MLCGKKKDGALHQLQVYFIPANEAEKHPLTQEFFQQQPKIATAAAAATILIPIAAHAAVGLVSHLSAKSQKAHILDLQQEVLLEGCYDSNGTCLLKDAFLAFSVGGTIKKETDDGAIDQDPLVLGIWKCIVSQDGTAIRLELKKWHWNEFLQPDDRNVWTCQSIKFRDVAISIELDYLSDSNAKWEFVFSNVTEQEMPTIMDATTDWEPAPTKPESWVETNEREQPQAHHYYEQEDSRPEEAPANPSSDGIETTLEQEPQVLATPAATLKEQASGTTSKSSKRDTAQYHVPVNLKIDVIETTRPHVLAPLLQQGAKAGSSIAGPLSKLVQSTIKV